MPGMPPLTIGMVVAQNADDRTLSVVMRTTGQSPVDVRFGAPGAADALRIKQPAMPGRGSWGLIAFPYGDERNGVWLITFYTSQVDAIHDDGTATAAFADYEATFSGFWRLLDGLGNLALQWPDGSYATVASGVGLPTIYRHTVNESQIQERVPFTFGQRVPNPPNNPFQFQYVQAGTGTTITVTTAGKVIVSTANDIAMSGRDITMTASRNMHLSANALKLHGSSFYGWDINGYGFNYLASGIGYVINEYILGTTPTVNQLSIDPPETPSS